MERATWTDARLDERMEAIDRNFELLRAELADLRAEMRAGFADIRGELTAIRRDFSAFQDRLIQIGFALVAVFIAVLGAVAVALVN